MRRPKKSGLFSLKLLISNSEFTSSFTTQGQKYRVGCRVIADFYLDGRCEIHFLSQVAALYSSSLPRIFCWYSSSRIAARPTNSASTTVGLGARPFPDVLRVQDRYSVSFKAPSCVHLSMPMNEVAYLFRRYRDAQRFQQYILDHQLMASIEINTIKTKRGTECRSTFLQLWRTVDAAYQRPIATESDHPDGSVLREDHFFLYFANNLRGSRQNFVAIPCRRQCSLFVHGMTY